MDRRSFLAASLAGTAALALPIEARAATLFYVPVLLGEKFERREIRETPNRVQLVTEGPILDRAARLSPAISQAWADTKNPVIHVRIWDREGSPWLGAGRDTFCVWDQAPSEGRVEHSLTWSLMFWVSEMFKERSLPYRSGERNMLVKSDAYSILQSDKFWREEEIGAFTLEVMGESDEIAELHAEYLSRAREAMKVPEGPAWHEEQGRVCELGRQVYLRRHGLV